MHVWGYTQAAGGNFGGIEDDEELDLSPDLGMDDFGEVQVGWW